MSAPVTFSPGAEPTREGYADENSANVRRAEFEGGYSQRSRPGPNSIARRVKVKWVVQDAIKEGITDFFETQGGVSSFLYQLPWDNEQALWTVTDWTAVPIGNRGGETVWRISTTLMREFDII